MGQRILLGLVGLWIVLGVVMALAAAQTFEEALWGPGGPRAYGRASAEDLPDIPEDDPWQYLSPDPGDDPGDGMMLLDDPPPQVWVVHPSLPGASEPALCPRKKPPSSSQSTTLLAYGGPPGGTYTWDCDPGADGEYAIYASAQVGLTHTAHVEYEVDEQSANATSGYIRVFDAELTLEGGPSDPQSTLEDDTGLFINVGHGRKALTLSLLPGHPHQLMPSGFNPELSPR